MSIRDQILEALVVRLRAQLTGWTVGRDDGRNAGGTPQAIVFGLGSQNDRTLRGDGAGELVYAVRYRAGVFLRVGVEDADAVTDGGNVFRYLDRVVRQVEAAIVHAPTWAAIDAQVRFDLLGHDVAELEEEDPTELSAVVGIEFQFDESFPVTTEDG